jgi:hypothetical protein
LALGVQGGGTDPPPEGGVKAPPSEPSSALRAPGEFTPTVRCTL